MSKPGLCCCLFNRQAGSSYVEVYVAIFVIMIALVPAIDALNHGINAAAVQQQSAQQSLLLKSSMEMLLSKPYSELSAQAGSPSTISGFSDPIDASPRRLVYLSHYDADNIDGDNDPFTGTEVDLLWIKVELEATGLNLETLVSLY